MNDRTKAPQTPASTMGHGLNAMSEDEFTLFVTQGRTLSISQVNARLQLVKVDAAALVALGITTRRLRSAVHMVASDFPALCEKLQELLSIVKNPQKPG